MKQRVLGICLGYEDLNDHDELCRDRLLALLCDCEDVAGARRQREPDRGKPLAGKSTLNRLELTLAAVARHFPLSLNWARHSYGHSSLPVA